MSFVRQKWFRALVICAVAASLCSGCKNRRGAEIDPDMELGSFADVGSLDDVGLGEERFATDDRLTDPDFQFEPVYFDYDSFRVKDAELAKIQQVAAKLRSDRGVVCVTEGHCDERGSREYNMSLGEHRALAIRASLISLGVDGGRLQTRSYGEESPAADGHDEGSWRLNRRVEFAFYRQ